MLFGKDTKLSGAAGNRPVTTPKAIKTAPKVIFRRRGDEQYVIEMDLLWRNDRIFTGLLPLMTLLDPL